MSEFHHISVLLNECIEALAIRPNGVYIDGTAGGAGHSSVIASHLGEGGKLLALDQDATAVAVATERLSRFGERAEVVHSNFCDLAKVCEERGIEHIDGLLLDLGVSSYQLDTAERGFSYRSDAPLDMRMSSDGITAAQLIERSTVSELANILRVYGDVKKAKGLFPTDAHYVTKVEDIEEAYLINPIVKWDGFFFNLPKQFPQRTIF